MQCGMCEAHICDVIRKEVPQAKQVAASRSKKEASFQTQEPVDVDRLKAEIDATGYVCPSAESAPYTKKHFWSK